MRVEDDHTPLASLKHPVALQHSQEIAEVGRGDGDQLGHLPKAQWQVQANAVLSSDGLGDKPTEQASKTLASGQRSKADRLHEMFVDLTAVHFMHVPGETRPALEERPEAQGRNAMEPTGGQGGGGNRVRRTEHGCRSPEDPAPRPQGEDRRLPVHANVGELDVAVSDNVDGLDTCTLSEQLDSRGVALWVVLTHQFP